MEYLHGEDARRLLTEVSRRGEQIPIGHVITVATAAAAGLHHAHEQRGPDRKPLGIVHRDVSPANIMIGYDGSVKVADFGIAKAEQRSTETRTGTLKGKIAYMSPEQCVGDDVDRRSDVFSLGIVLYELVTARRLFKGDNDFLTMTAIVHGQISPPSKYRADLPSALEAIILKALAKDRDDRYATADDLRIALEQFANEAGISRSSTALADYLKAKFGNRPEPWLDDDDEPEIEMSVDFDGSASGAARPPIEALEQFTAERSDAPIQRARRKAITASLAPHAVRKRSPSWPVDVAEVAAMPASARRRRWWWGGAMAVMVAGIGIALAFASSDPPPAEPPPPEQAVRTPERIPSAHLAPVAAVPVEQVSTVVAEPAALPAVEVEPAPPEPDEAARERTVRPAIKKRVPPAAKRARKTKPAEHWDPHALFPE
ncbi:MAG TPA: protein kinase, partial [Kofleriaceae bacterium]|nr:protein kinase [Kofleriaceae bacterium]